VSRRGDVHAIDGGALRGALCEEPTGDSTDREREVTCPDCLDQLEETDWTDPRPASRASRLRRAGWTPIERLDGGAE
jgi:hypothetical protein